MGGKRIAGKVKLRKGTVPKKRVPDDAGPPKPDYIVWRMGRLIKAGDFSWLDLDTGLIAALESELVEFETRPLHELKQLKWLKFIESDEFTPKGQKAFDRISDKRMGGDTEGLWQLHLATGRWRIWGHFEDPMFFMVWWDPEHEACTGKSVSRRYG